MAIGSCKPELTGAGEVATRLADTAAMRTTHIRVDVSHTPIWDVTRHSNRTAVNHWAWENKTSRNKIRWLLRWTTVHYCTKVGHLWLLYLGRQQNRKGSTLARGCLAVVLAVFTGLALVVFRTGAVEVTQQAVAWSLVLTGVRYTGVWVKQTLHLQTRQGSGVRQVFLNYSDKQSGKLWKAPISLQLKETAPLHSHKRPIKTNCAAKFRHPSSLTEHIQLGRGTLLHI